VALAAGIAVMWHLGAFAPHLEPADMFVIPRLYMPALSWPALLDLVLPLAITVLVVQNGQGFAVLTAAGHRPPFTAITLACGAGSIVCAFVGTVSTCLTGPVSAIISSSGEARGQYTAGLVVAALGVVLGLLAPLLTRLLLATPPAFIATLAGLAMLRVLQNAFAGAFGGRFMLGALVTLLVTVAGVPIFNIGAPFWALIAGVGVSLLVERADWRAASTRADSAVAHKPR
jgi:benzoate membrane transport protein